MPRILLLHTGGTLGMSGGRPGSLRPAAFFKTLRARAPELFELADLTLERHSDVDSAELQPESWSALARTLHERLPHFDGAVVTHGTDTLAYTAAALSFMLPTLQKPVVLTGAQRPLGEVRTDARQNLIDAVISALQGPREVTVCFDSHLYRGNRVQKVKVSEYDAFESPNFPVLGTLGVDAHFLRGLVRRGKNRLLDALDPRVFLLKVFPGMDPTLTLGMLPKLRGLVVEAYGAGTFPVQEALGRSLLPLFKEARRLGVAVLVVSQVSHNGVDLALYESGAKALSLGAIGGGDMTASAALVKLMHGLAYHRPDSLRRYLDTSIAGERTPPRRPAG
jgi:L-asparaginase